MLTIPAKTVYIVPAVRAQENCAKRLERVLPHVKCDDIRPLDDAAMAAVRSIGKQRHGKDAFGDDAVVVFTTFDPERVGWYYHLREAAVEFQTLRATMTGLSPLRELCDYFIGSLEEYID